MSNGRILLVEDEPMLHFLWEDICAINDFEVAFTAMTCQEALAYLEENSDDLSGVILDVNLHGEMSNRVAAYLRTLALPVVVSTGSHPDTLPLEFKGWPTLCKPYRPHDIVSILPTLAFSKQTVR